MGEVLQGTEWFDTEEARRVWKRDKSVDRIGTKLKQNMGLKEFHHQLQEIGFAVYFVERAEPNDFFFMWGSKNIR